MPKSLHAALIALLCALPATALADGHDTWPCTLVPAACTAPPPINTSVPWFEANAANAVTAIVLCAVLVISTRRQRWESTPADREERKKRWSSAPSYNG
jgi:hypothetical protein